MYDDTLTTDERIDMLEDAREALEQAIRLIRDATRRTLISDRAAAYILPTLRMCASAEHEFLGKQPANIDELIRDLREEANDGDA